MTKNINIPLLSLVFFLIFIIRNGAVYSFGDILWVDFFIRADVFTLENDILGFAKNISDNYWIKITKFFSKYLNKYLIFYIYYFLHIYLYFFIIFKIFLKLSYSNNIFKYILIGLAVSNIKFITGALVYLSPGTFNYKDTANILLLIALYFLIVRKKYYISKLIYLVSAIIHLPSSIAFLPISFCVILKKRFKIIAFIFFVLINCLIIIYYYSGTSGNVDLLNNFLIKELLNLRIPYLYFENWETLDKINFILIYFNLILLVLISPKNYRYLLIMMLLFHLIYLLFVSLTNEFKFLSTFKYGFDLKILVIIFIFEFVNKINKGLEINLNNILIFSGVMSLFFFSNQFLLLILFGFVIFFNNKKLLISNLF